MLRRIDTNLWVAEQSLRYSGLSVGTRMTVIRLSTNDLVLISPIQAHPSLVAQLNELGNIRYLVAPNLSHHFFIESMQAHFPTGLFHVPERKSETKIIVYPDFS